MGLTVGDAEPLRQRLQPVRFVRQQPASEGAGVDDHVGRSWQSQLVAEPDQDPAVEFDQVVPDEGVVARNVSNSGSTSAGVAAPCTSCQPIPWTCSAS